MNREYNVSQMLDYLASEDFLVAIGPVNSPSALRRHLHKMDEIRLLRAAFECRFLSQSKVYDWSHQLLREFRPGESFQHDLSLAAMVVVIERVKSHFTEEFLYDLARLDIAEMPLSSAVAKLAIQSRVQRPRLKRQENSFTVKVEMSSVWRCIEYHALSQKTAIVQEEKWGENAAA